MGATVFGIGAAMSAVFAVYNLRPLLHTEGSDVGGIAAVNSATIQVLQYVVPPIVAFYLSRRVRGRGRMARDLRRAHLFTTVGWVILLGMLSMITLTSSREPGVNGIWFAMFGMLVGGALWLPVQTLFSAAFLGLLVRGTHRMSRHASSPG